MPTSAHRIPSFVKFAVFTLHFLLDCAVTTYAQYTDNLIHESRQNVPNGFKPLHIAPSDTILELKIALAQANPSGLEQVLYDVSTPNSVNYGQYLSKEEVRHSDYRF